MIINIGKKMIFCLKKKYFNIERRILRKMKEIIIRKV